MDLIEPETGKITIDGETLAKLLLLVLFGIAALLTILKLINYIIYKIYVKFCQKKGKDSKENNQKLVANSMDQSGNNMKIRKQSTFIQIESEDDFSTENSGPVEEIDGESGEEVLILLSPKFPTSGTKNPSLFERFTK